MLKKSLVEIIFRAFSIQRWNDKLRPLELIQMDKHAHKMIIAWCLGKYEEDKGAEFVWEDIIKGGIYELLRRIVISDIQSPIYKEIAKNKKLLKKLNKHIYEEIEPKIGNKEIKEEFKNYLFDPDYIHPLSRQILEAAHKYSSYWEFQIIRNVNPDGYQIEEIEMQIGNDIELYSSLEGIKKLKKNHQIKNFVDLCGQMRYQIRWGHLPRIPKTSVLGHVMLVASISYLLTKELPNVCPKRIYNNFFGGIFHDLPEAITRDIIKPVKRSVPGMSEEIKKIEQKLTEEEIYPHVEKSWLDELKYYTIDEFDSKIHFGERVSSEEINEKYNSDNFNPYDGELVKAADNFSAFLEAWNSIQFGLGAASELNGAMATIKDDYKNKSVAGIPINELYEDFL